MALLDFCLALCKRQCFISSGFTTPSFTPNASSKHGTWEISNVKNLERERVRRGLAEQQWGSQNHLGPPFLPL